MIKLQERINELEVKGLSKKEIESQTHDLFEQLVNEPLLEESSYMIDLNLTLKVDTKMKQERLQALLHEPIIKKLILDLDDAELTPEVLHVDLNEVQDWEKL